MPVCIQAKFVSVFKLSIAATGGLQLDYVKTRNAGKSCSAPFAALATVINNPDSSGLALKVGAMIYIETDK